MLCYWIIFHYLFFNIKNNYLFLTYCTIIYDNPFEVLIPVSSIAITEEKKLPAITHDGYSNNTSSRSTVADNVLCKLFHMELVHINVIAVNTIFLNETTYWRFS